MSALYPDLDFTNYPGQLDNIELKSNITNATDAQLVEQIQASIIAGDFANASAILNANPQLNGKIFNANDYNQIRDAILALERFYNNDIKNYISEKQASWVAEVDKYSFKGVYSPTTQYEKNNMVNFTTDEGTFLYLCLQRPDTGIPPTNTTYWRILTIKGERGLSGEGLSFTWGWNSMMEYNVNDVAIYGNKWWAATQKNRGKIPANDSQYWTEVLTALPAEQIPVTNAQPTDQILGDQWYQVI
ncbi:MAG: hypothetical protein MSS80_07730 [Mollicutes bacterium]|nr:hypothetical protein [Mollicutes bacterium]